MSWEIVILIGIVVIEVFFLVWLAEHMSVRK